MDAAKSKQLRADLAVPAHKAERDGIRAAVRQFCAASPLAPPVRLDEIEAQADRILADHALAPAWRGFVCLLVGNETWRSTVAATPFDRRILLLPQCLRSSTACAATSDALGLLCEGCGRCSIDGIQQEAEDLGYVVLVAEGATAVSELLARGEADAIVGVSCMEALEKFFHPLTRNAIPGVAVPLLRDGCVDTQADRDWIRETLRLRDPAAPAVRRLDVQALRREVAAWFAPEPLAALLEGQGTATEAAAVEWLARDGKRWRPTLTAGVYQALAADPNGPVPDRVRRVAVAVECFHKASLIHDDIEDEDDTRYGAPTFHRRHGVAVAINAGDLLIGEGYRLLSESGSPEEAARMLAVAARGHRTLCLGQGEELLLRAAPDKLTVAAVLEIFRRKTAPAYEISLLIGAICAGADAGTLAVLSAYSEALGIAYQIRDDLADARPASGDRPALLAALARETAGGGDPEARARELLHQYADRALRALAPLRNATLKSLLYRLVSKIVDPVP